MAADDRSSEGDNVVNQSGTKPPLGIDAEGILRVLTTRQHLNPHRPLNEAMSDLVGATGACPAAASRAVEWLDLATDRPIGRLRRAELIQLARSMYRFWLESRTSHLTSAPD